MLWNDILSYRAVFEEKKGQEKIALVCFFKAHTSIHKCVSNKKTKQTCTGQLFVCPCKTYKAVI